jgi:F-type H+-transporting ATPase subunit epsilon
VTIHVNIVSAEGEIFTGDADMVFAPARVGEIGIAPRHAPLLTTLKPGSVRVQTAEGEKLFYVTGGILEIQPHLVTVLADSALHAHQLDEAEALANTARSISHAHSPSSSRPKPVTVPHSSSKVSAAELN